MEHSSFTVAGVFGDHMVWQRNKPVKIWGESAKAQTLRVFVDGSQAASARVERGPWQLTLPAMDARRGLTVDVVGDDPAGDDPIGDGPAERVTFRDVAVGEVWIAGGQSNMAFTLAMDAEARRVIPGASRPDIRFYDVPKVKFAGQEQEDDLSAYGFWRPLTPEHAPHYSAVGYYFARKLYERCQVPVGIVGCNWGGTTAATWLDERQLKADAELRVYWQDYENSLKTLDLDAYLAAEQAQRQTPPPFQQRFSRFIGRHTPALLLYPLFTAIYRAFSKNGLPLGPRDINRPGGLYETMVRRIAGYTARGVIWYQGETDDTPEKAARYACIFSALIGCWRAAWEDALPFLFVQLAPYEKWMIFDAVNFHVLREQQELVSKTVPGAYMVSIMDAGARRDVHPKRKRVVGERLALLARGKVYGEDILCEAPEAASLKAEGGRVMIPFRHVGDGLRLNGGPLKGLELLADGQAVPIHKVTIGKDTLTVEVDATAAKELEVRLAYRNYAEVNLYNSAGLAAKPFRRVVAVAEAAGS